MVQFERPLYLLCILAFLYYNAHWIECLVEENVFGNTILTREEKHTLNKIDIKHILGHVAEMMGKDYPGEKMDDKRFRFYFFKFHDDNDDSLLDGLELVKSVIHFYDELAAFDPSKKVDAYPDEMLARPVDNLLEAHDKNKDGFLDYLEFTVDAPLEL